MKFLYTWLEGFGVGFSEALDHYGGQGVWPTSSTNRFWEAGNQLGFKLGSKYRTNPLAEQISYDPQAKTVRTIKVKNIKKVVRPEYQMHVEKPSPQDIERVAKALWEKHKEHAFNDLCSTVLPEWDELQDDQIRAEWLEKAEVAITAY